MAEILERLTALCALAAVGQLLTPGGRLQNGVRLIGGLAAAELMLEAARALPGALIGG